MRYTHSLIFKNIYFDNYVQTCSYNCDCLFRGFKIGSFCCVESARRFMMEPSCAWSSFMQLLPLYLYPTRKCRIIETMSSLPSTMIHMAVPYCRYGITAQRNTASCHLPVYLWQCCFPYRTFSNDCRVPHYFLFRPGNVPLSLIYVWMYVLKKVSDTVYSWNSVSIFKADVLDQEEVLTTFMKLYAFSWGRQPIWLAIENYLTCSERILLVLSWVHVLL